MTPDVAGDVILIERLGVIEEGGRVDPDPWVEAARPVTVVRKLHERVVLAQGDGTAVRCVRAHPEARPLAGEGERRLDLGVPGKRLGTRQVDGAAVSIQPEVALVGPTQPTRHVHDIREEIGSRVHQQASPFFRDDVERGDGRRRERFLHRDDERRVVRPGRPESRVTQHEVHPRADTLKLGDRLVADHAPVQTDPVHAEAGGERGQIEEVAIEPPDLDKEAPCSGVPV